MEYMRPEMVDHDGDGDRERRPPGEQARETGGDVTANPGAAASQVPPPPPQRGSPGDDNPRGRASQADTADQQRAWQNADDGAEQPYSTTDPV